MYTMNPITGKYGTAARSFVAVFSVIVLWTVSVAAQKAVDKTAIKPGDPIITGHVAASPAYAEILLWRTEISSELESLLVDYTEEFPKIKELRFSLEIMKREANRLNKVKAADAGRLTLALGKLIVRKVELETEVWRLSASFQDEHPEVKRAKRRVETYESAIKEILG